jgi:2-polyprenylphenol 6-hydroxylase
MATSAEIMNADVAIIGAGLVGLTAAIAMAKQGKQLVLIDSQPNHAKAWKPAANQWDARIYALTEETIEWLKSLGVWQYVDETRVQPITAMELWEPSRNKPLMLSAEDAYLPQMGCILENANLMHACYQALKASNVQVTVASPTSLIQGTHSVEITLDQQQHVHVKLIVAADGVHSWVRQQLQIGVAFKSFHQTAIVANFTAEQGHQGVARQWFLPHETMALLPLPNHMVSMVWAVSTERAQTLLNLSQDELLVEVSNVSEDVLGKLSLSGEVVSFVLNQQTAESYIKDRVVLVGDAAHQVHPMAGQGVNLGFRDVMQLASMTTKLSTMQDIGDYHFLRRYERARKLDVVSMNTLTSGLDALFATSSPWLQQVTGWSMQKINQQDWLKKQLVQTATL